MISYEKLKILMAVRGISWGTLRNDLKFESRTIQRLKQDCVVDLVTLMKLCSYLKCNIGDICDYIECPRVSIRELL